jgi:anti-sigma regulatory factor (Ser/Thr protein kinase)
VQCALELRFLGTLEEFERAYTQLRRALDALQLDAAARYNAELVFEEIVANVVRHGAPGSQESHLHVRVALDLGLEAIRLTFEDNGVPFNPRARPDPPPPTSLDHEGGFGLILVHHAASSIDYERTAEGRNRLTVTLPRAAGSN